MYAPHLRLPVVLRLELSVAPGRLALGLRSASLPLRVWYPQHLEAFADDPILNAIDSCHGDFYQSTAVSSRADFGLRVDKRSSDVHYVGWVLAVRGSDISGT